MQTLLIVDFFSNKCDSDTLEQCNLFRPTVPMSPKFNNTAFKDYCG